MLTVGSLFSGIGGIDLGLERAGMRVQWQVEIDPWCRRVLGKHWPDVSQFEDVRDVGAHNLPRVDVLAGGFPCQPFSSAGQRRGQQDDRWLWPEFARLIRELRPGYIFVENVPGLLIRGMGDVLGDLAESGYDAEWDCIPAAAVGAPHLRDRVWLVAYTDLGRLCGSSSDKGNGSPVLAQGKQRVVRGGDGGQGAVAGQPPRIFGGQRPGLCEWWRVEPDVGRVAHGIPRRVDRLRGLGNAVVPQVVELIGRWIIQDAER